MIYQANVLQGPCSQHEQHIVGRMSLQLFPICISAPVIYTLYNEADMGSVGHLDIYSQWVRCCLPVIHPEVSNSQRQLPEKQAD